MDRSTEEAKSVRYYTYSVASGRRRVPDEWSTDDHTAVNWASAMFASGLPDNVVREEGPPTKPTSITILWERNPTTTGFTPTNVAVASLEIPTMSTLMATGADRREALNRLMDAWSALRDRYPVLMQDQLFEEDATVLEGPLGSVFLDGQPL